MGMTLVALILVAGISSAATSGPTAGDWSGKLKGVHPATSLTFTVTASGRKRAVSNFLASSEIKVPCKGAELTGIGTSGSATVSHAGKFKSVEIEDNGFGTNSWTVTGTFKNTHSASGTVAIDLFLSTANQCKFTVKWSAAEEAAKPPKHGATYTGTATAGDSPVKFTVSSNGKQLTSISWDQPLIGGACPGLAPGVVKLSGHDVPVHGSKFSYTQIAGSGGDHVHETISGQFLAGGKAAGGASTFAVLTGFGNTCQGSDTWSAHS
jgi:hypothetical protein